MPLENITLFLYLDVFGTIVFALTGIMVAARHDMDLFGAIVLATVTAIGGGTLRDILLDIQPFWMKNVLALYVILGTSILSFIGIHFIERIPRRAVDIADAIGLATFTVLGAVKAHSYGMPSEVAIILGIMTGTAGGAIRDILCNVVPAVLKERSFYATASFAGALFWVLTQDLIEFNLGLILAGLITFGLRMLAIMGYLHVPGFPKKES